MPSSASWASDWVRKAEAATPNVFVTRLHIRYSQTSFFEDLKFAVTEDRENFQGRYVLNHPFEGEITCDGGQDLRRRRPGRGSRTRRRRLAQADRVERGEHRVATSRRRCRSGIAELAGLEAPGGVTGDAKGPVPAAVPAPRTDRQSGRDGCGTGSRRGSRAATRGRPCCPYQRCAWRNRRSGWSQARQSALGRSCTPPRSASPTRAPARAASAAGCQHLVLVVPAPQVGLDHPPMRAWPWKSGVQRCGVT